MKNGIVKAMIIASTFGSLICGATTTVMAEETSKETEVKANVTVEKKAPSFTLNVDNANYGEVKTDNGVLKKSFNNMIRVTGDYTTDEDKVDIAVQRIDDVGEGKFSLIQIDTVGRNSRKEIGKEQVNLYSGVSGNKFSSGSFEDGKTGIVMNAWIDRHNWKSGTYTAQLKWTLTPHL